MRAHVVEREARVEEAHERPERGAGVLVLGLAEQQRAAALEIAQVDVVAERRADDAPVRGDDQHRLRLGVVPMRMRVEAGVGAAADRRHRLRLGEDLRVRADADLQILRPRALARSAPPSAARPPASPASARARSSPISRPISARMRAALSAVAARALLDHPLQHRGGEGDARRLDRLQIDGREQPGLRGDRGCRAACWRAVLASAPMRSPVARRAAPRRGRGCSARSRIVAKAGVTSNTPSGADRDDARGRRGRGGRRGRRARRQNRRAAGFPFRSVCG